MPAGVRAAVIRSLKDCGAYPDPECRALRQALAQYTGVPADRILCGNGASELIEAAVRAIRPETVLISVGRNNYGHPSDHVLKRLEKLGADVYTTLDCGQIEIRR